MTRCKQSINHIEYLEKVIANWDSWQSHHTHLVQAIKGILAENTELKGKIKMIEKSLDDACERRGVSIITGIDKRTFVVTEETARELICKAPVRLRINGVTYYVANTRRLFGETYEITLLSENAINVEIEVVYDGR